MSTDNEQTMTTTTDNDHEDNLKRKLNEPNNNFQNETIKNGSTDDIVNNKKLKTDYGNEGDNDDDDDVQIVEDHNASKNFNEIIQELKLNTGFKEHLDALKQFYQDENFQINNSEFIEQNFNIIRQPFKVGELRNLIEDDDIINKILQNAKTLGLDDKNNDLFSIQQSKDLKNYKIFKNVVDFFQNHVRTLIENITGLKLNGDVALTFSKYEKNDYLLCHDDQLEKRKIAFIYYLVDKEWSSADGGQLELFSMNEDKTPSKIVERLTPKWNSLAFFQVGYNTFHQVGEVLTDRSARWSINGWFHADDVELVEPKLTYPMLPLFPKENQLTEDLQSHFYQWISPQYLQPMIQKQIREDFYLKSEIQLPDFLLKSKLRELETALKSNEVKEIWKENYQPLFCRYEYIHPDDFDKLPDILKEFYLMIHSKSFYHLITRLTGVSFGGKSKSSSKTSEQSLLTNKTGNGDKSENDAHNKDSNTNNNNENSKKSTLITRSSIQQWNHGFYTLSSDINPEINEKALDIDMFFNLPREQISSSKEFGEQEIIQISDSDDDDDEEEDDDDVEEEKDNNKNEQKHIQKKEEQNENPKDINSENKISEDKKITENITASGSSSSSIQKTASTNKSEPEVIELDDEDSDIEEIDDDDGGDEDIDDEEDDEEEEDDDDDQQYSNNGLPMNGGYIAYITTNSNQQILDIEPNSGNLYIVYRHYHCQRFMKYIDHGNNKVPFQHVSMVYTETNNNSNNGNDNKNKPGHSS